MIDAELIVKVGVAVVATVAVCVIVYRLTERGYVLRVRGRSVEVEMRPAVPASAQKTDPVVRDHV